MFLGWDWGFQVEDDLKTPIFWGFLLKSALKVNRLALRESVFLVVMMMVIVIMMMTVVRMILIMH